MKVSWRTDAILALGAVVVALVAAITGSSLLSWLTVVAAALVAGLLMIGGRRASGARTGGQSADAVAHEFEDAIASEVRRSHRTGRPVSLVLCEVDRVGDLDGQYGSGTGVDSVGQVAELLRSSAREIDLVTQVGADQFGILLPETTAAGAALVAERLRTAISRWSPQRGVPLTASFGVACWADNEDILEDAALALDDARRQGRDCVVVSGDDDLAS